MQITQELVREYLELSPEGTTWDIWNHTKCILAKALRKQRVMYANVGLSTYTYREGKKVHTGEVPLWYRQFLRPWIMEGRVEVTREEALQRLEEMR